MILTTLKTCKDRNTYPISVQISVIIPTYNEEKSIAKTIQAVKDNSNREISEIIVSDGGSRDRTPEAARLAGARVVRAPKGGRAPQMNFGASHAASELLYFLHADSIPPEGYDSSIVNAVQKGYSAGCFRLCFDHPNLLLRMFAWFTRFDIDAFRFGDQSLFITSRLFTKIDGFREDHIVMEDQEIVRRIKRNHHFALLTDSVTTSARKYLETGVLKLQFVFLIIFSLYYAGVQQETLKHIYSKLLTDD